MLLFSCFRMRLLYFRNRQLCGKWSRKSTSDVRIAPVFSLYICLYVFLCTVCWSYPSAKTNELLTVVTLWFCSVKLLWGKVVVYGDCGKIHGEDRACRSPEFEFFERKWVGWCDRWLHGGGPSCGVEIKWRLLSSRLLPPLQVRDCSLYVLLTSVTVSSQVVDSRR